MSGLQRWTFDGPPAYAHENGGYVLYAEHLAEVERVRAATFARAYDIGDAEGAGEAIQRCIEAVGALPVKVLVSLESADCNHSCDEGPCTCSGLSQPMAWDLDPAAVLAALKAVTP